MCCCGVSKTDLVNSGWYFTELFVFISGITTLAGLGGSFLGSGLGGGGGVDTNDFGCWAAATAGF